MIHAFALEPMVVASWGRREGFRFIHDKFGLGRPRAMLELPAFSKWKRDVYGAANELRLSEQDMKRVEELFRLLGERRCRRSDAAYDGLITWLQNAEREHDRKPFAGIVATTNPRAHRAVLLGDQLGPGEPRWEHPAGATSARTPEGLAGALSAMLLNCTVLHLVDPHFGPENARHRRVLEALARVVAARGPEPMLVRVHSDAKAALPFFEAHAAQMASGLPRGVTVEFVRWQERGGGEKLHNRYVLTDLGGVMVGVGLDAGSEGQTDDLVLLTRDQHALRWSQYVDENGAFTRVDAPAPVRGRQA